MQAIARRVRGWSFVDAVLIFALIGFLSLSGFAAFEGLFDIILAEQPALATERQWYYILGAVGLITAAMWALLEVALRRGQFRRRLPAALMYAVLALWSIGFGYGFWWKVIASRSETRSGIEAAADTVQKQVDTAENAVSLVEGLLGSVIDTADSKQKLEVSSGSSCGITSKPGDGPLSKRRSGVTSQVGALKGNVEKLWLAPLREVLNGKPGSNGQSVGGLKAAQAKLDVKLMRELSEDGRRRVYDDVRKASTAGINAIATLNNTQGKFFAKEFRTLADNLDIPPTKASSTCYDPDLARDLRSAASVAEANPTLTIPEFEVNEGAAATAKAFNKIWDNIFWFARQLPASVGLISTGPSPEPLKGRDIIALIAAIVVDLCICTFAFVRTRSPLDASHMFQPAHAGARAKLESAIRAFAADDDLDARKVFNACILRSGRSYYFILPHLSSPMSPLWRPGAIFLQNVLIVLEAVHAVQGDYEATGGRAFWRSLIPGLGPGRLFEKAARQLRESGWGSEPIEPNGNSSIQSINPTGLSLHRLRHTDLLEFLLLLRQNISTANESTTNVAGPIKAPPKAEQWPRTTLKRMSAGLHQILSGIRERANARRSMPTRASGAGSFVPAIAGMADASSHPELLQTPTQSIANDRDGGEAVPETTSDQERSNGPQKSQSDLSLFSEFVASQRPHANNNSGNSVMTTNHNAPPDQADFDATSKGQGAGLEANATGQKAVLAEPRAAATEPQSEDTSVSVQRRDELFGHIDNLNRAVDFAKQYPASSEDTRKIADESRRLTEELERAGLARTAEIGQRADPHFHYILVEEPSPTPRGTITRVNAQGYRETESGRLVREAQVIVSDGSMVGAS